MPKDSWTMRPEIRKAHNEIMQRKERLEADRKARLVALEVMKLILEKQCDIMDLKHLAFPGLSYALDCGWVTKEHEFYVLTVAGELMFSKLEQPAPNPDALPRVLLKARQLSNKADLESEVFA
jgi:hypothetical protein